MLKFLNKPYPFNDNLQHNIKVVFAIGIVIVIFLLIFQPFEIINLELRQKLYLVLGYGLATFMGLSFNLLLLPVVHPKIFI